MKTSSNPRQESSRLPLYLTAALILAVTGAYFLWPEFGETVSAGWQVLKTGDQRKISEWVRQFSFWGPLFIILFMVFQMFLFVVNVVVIIVVAVLAYGPVLGSLLALLGVLVASSIGYGIGRLWGKKAAVKFIGSKAAAKVEEKVDRYGLWAVVIARISPFLSNDAISFIAGTGGMGFLKFMGATLAGISPLIIFIAILGEDFERLKTGLIWVSAITIAAFLVYYFYDNRQQKKKER